MIDWEEIQLAGHADFRFPDGISGTIRLKQQRAPLESRHKEFATIAIEGVSQIQLNDCIDTSPNNDEPSVLIVRGEPTDKILLFGGEVSYVISSKGQVIKEIPAFRKRRNDKFWRTEVVRLSNDSILIVYEVGAFVIESSLDVRWHIEKALIDFFDHQEESGLVFLRDHEVAYMINVKTGQGVPAINE
jgi:hypothetical protein